jgi:hypothetical protein
MSDLPDEGMSAEELAAFVARTRADLQAQLAELDAWLSDALPAEERDEMRRRIEQLLAATTDEAITLHLDAVLHAGRELTDDEWLALLTQQ